MRLGTQQEVKDYFANPAVSQSQLKMILKGVPPVKEESKLYYEEKGHFLVGSAVDIWITQGYFAFQEQFYTSTITKPSDQLMSIIKDTFDRLSMEIEDLREIDFDQCRSDIWASCNRSSYYMNRVKSNPDEDKRVDTILEHSYYWDELINSKDKQILSLEEYQLVERIVTSLKTNPETRHCFVEGEFTDIWYQYPIYFEHKGLQCKALLDMVKIDHIDKIVYPYDIKTTGDYSQYFQSNFKKFRYDFQAAFYSLALKSLPQFKDYKIAPFQFIVESTSFQNPLIYGTTSQILNDAYFGRRICVKSECGGEEIIKDILGISQAIDLWKWHQEFGFDKNPNKENGVITLNRL